MIATALVGLGSNLEPRREHLQRALAALRARFGPALAVSPAFDTRPLGPPQPRYLNAAAACAVTEPPEDVLRHLLAIERGLGRVRGERWGPRTIDLDLLAWVPAGEDRSVAHDSPSLQLPHPGLRARDFVLLPLTHVFPQLRVDGHGLDALLAALPADARTLEHAAPGLPLA